MAIERQVTVIVSPEGTIRILIMERADGLYRFVVERSARERGKTFWEPLHFSGLYQTVSEAEQAARQGMPWTSGRISE